jgi:hypothetical protein
VLKIVAEENEIERLVKQADRDDLIKLAVLIQLELIRRGLVQEVEKNVKRK